MEVEEVTRRGAEILALEDDQEAAHSALDELWYDVLKAISTGRLAGDDATLAARRAVEPAEHITRWYA